ncbi:MAG TPA: hypothetical protein PK239_05850 [Chitinophagales bacterium]|nr:hypothetical protein [Chitinophagales bacterium]HRK26801.1 hypothetical protein [Chitinophagales bacterium]
MKIRLFVSLLALFFALTALRAQQTNTIRLLITDTENAKMVTIDTLLPAGANVDAVLAALGYDQNSIARANAGSKRQITIATEEIVEIPSKISRPEGSPFASNPNMVKLDNTPTITANQQLKIEDIVKIPEGAVVEDMPDGSKRILTQEKDEFGNTYTKQTTVRMGSREGVADEGGYTGSWVNMDGKTIPPANEPLNWTTESFSHSGSSYPSVQITLADCDMFDMSTLNSRDKSLINAEPLAVKGFMVKPDFKEGYLRFTFTLPNETPTQLIVYDVVGAKLHDEVVSGTYNKLIPEFNLYRKGTFLVLLKQDGKKFTHRLSID